MPVAAGRALGAAVALLLAAVFSACGSARGEAEQPGGTPPPAVAAATPATAAPSGPTPPSSPEAAAPLPDIVRELLDEVSALRELEAPPGLRARTVSSRDLPALFERLTTDKERRHYDQITTLYRLLGHLQRDQTVYEIQQSFLGNVAGLYSPSEKTLWVVTAGEEVGLDDLSQVERFTLVHEILHAIQDYHFDLEATLDRVLDHLDASLAFTALVEGDAVVYSSRYARRFIATPAGGWRFLLGAPLQIDRIPPAVNREIYFPYTTGADAVQYLLAEEGVERLNALLADPLVTTTHILHPELLGSAWEPEVPSRDALPWQAIRASLGPSWRLQTGSLGEFQLLNYLVGDSPTGGSGWIRSGANRTAVEAAAGWSGDRYFLFENGEQSVLVALVRFASTEDAREFAAVHLTLTTTEADTIEEPDFTLARQENGNVIAHIEPLGREVLFAIGSTEAVVRAVLTPLLEG